MAQLHERYEPDTLGAPKVRGRKGADLLQQMTALQRQLNARNFAVLRVSGSGLSSKRSIKILADNFPTGACGAQEVLDLYGDAMVEHIDVSILPLLWNGRDESSTSETVDFDTFVTRLRGRTLPFAGIAFPVRLGSTGNGFAVFTSAYLDLTSETILDTHLQVTGALARQLQYEERRGQPAEMLTEREIACLQMAGDGRTSEEIAEKLGLSVHTVNAYLGTATTKLDSVNRIQAIAKAIRLGYIN
ncbi:regulatory protein, luxR family [Ensifer adhaerens]|nr:regulatory protein, luxR family [Ensifer adhaerens]